MTAGVNSQKKKNHETANYHRTQMQKEIVIQRLREQGCRITKQRLMLLDVILNEDCSCCKEIYYRAAEVYKEKNIKLYDFFDMPFEQIAKYTEDMEKGKIFQMAGFLLPVFGLWMNRNFWEKSVYAMSLQKI